MSTTATTAAAGSLLSKSLENEEWEEFLDGTLADAIENPQTLEQRDLVAVVVAPLRNVNASPSLVERIATLLALPWAGVDREESVDEEAIIRAYADTRVVPNLLYACKVMVQRRSGDNRSTGYASSILCFCAFFFCHFNSFSLCVGVSIAKRRMPSSLLMIYNLWKCCWAWWHVWYTSARPQVIAHRSCVTRNEGVANHRLSLSLFFSQLNTHTEFINQFCDAVCVLDCAAAIHHLLSVDRRKAHAVGHVLAILSHVLRTRAENVSVVQDILAQRGHFTLRHFFGLKGFSRSIFTTSFFSLFATTRLYIDTNLVRLLSNRNPLIRSRCCTLIGYLSLR